MPTSIKSAMLVLIAFFSLFAILSSATKARIKDLFGAAVVWMVCLGAAGWIVGSIIQAIRYGAITAPCCQ